MQWDAKTLGEWVGALAGADVVVHLAGKRVDCRPTSSNIQQLIDSRVGTVRLVGAAIATETLVGQSIYVIGRGSRPFTETPVCRLDLGSMRMERVTSTGNAPGWIYNHRAELINSTAIRITGGTCVHKDGQSSNDTEFILDLETLQWRRTGRDDAKVAAQP